MNSSRPNCRIRLIGGFAIEGGTGKKFRTRKTASLAAFLSLYPGKSYSKDTLCQMFWTEEDTENPRQSLRMTQSGLRASLGDVVFVDRESVWIDADLVTSDYSDFVASIDNASKAGANEKAILAEALELAEGVFCLGVEGDWIQAARIEFEDKLASATVRFLSLCLASDDYATGVDCGTRVLKQVGMREDLAAALIEICIKAGFYTLALSHFEALEKVLMERWGLHPGPQTTALLESIPILPRQSRSIVGRQEEFQQLVQRFYSSKGGQIVCLTGPGGIGKTTLARAVLRELETAGRWVRFVDLTAANSLNSAIRIICTVLQLGEIDLSDAPRAIAKTLVSQKGVAALDNLEQLGTDAERLVADILKASNEVNLILTTRARIDHPDVDWVEIRPLVLPQSKASIDEVRLASSAQLFEKRAIQASQGFVINRSNVEAVVDLCQKLDGLPLALEIAAAKVLVQTPGQIIEQIQKSFVSLEKKHGSKSARHTSINAAVNWSVGLLEPDEQQAALRLSLINGHFSAVQAAQITELSDVLGVLEVLVRASLLNSDSSGHETQFWMYETVRLSLQDLFRDQEALVEARNRHFDVTIQRLKAIAAIKDQPAWKVMQMDLAACPDALDCMDFFADRGERAVEVAETALRIQDACRMFGLSDRNVKCMEQVLDALQDEKLWSLLGVAIVKSQANRGSEEEKLEILRRCETAAGSDVQILLQVKSQLATSLKSLGRIEDTVEQLNWVERHCGDGDSVLLSWNLYQQNQVAFLKGDREATLEYLRRALEVGRRHDDINRLIRILFDYGAELAYHQRFEESLDCFEEAIAHSQRIRSLKLEGLTRWQYGDALISMERPREALEMLLKSVDLVYEANYQVAEKWIFLNTVDAAVALGLFEPAAMLLGKGLHVRAVENRPFALSEEEDIRQCKEVMIDRLGRSEFERMLAEGRDSGWQAVWGGIKAAFKTL